MPASTLSPQAVASPLAAANHVETTRDADDCLSIVNLARETLDKYLAQPGDKTLRQQLAIDLRAASAAVAALSRKNHQIPAVEAALGLVRAISNAGAAGRIGAELGAPTTIDARAHKHWPGIIARMLLQAPWQARGAQPFSDIPDWLWGDYAAWVFAAPHSFFAAEEAEAFARHQLQRMDELARWVKRNVGSAAVRSALQSYLSTFSFLPLTVSGSDLKQHSALHSRLLTAGTRIDSSVTITPGGREGRPLRVAFVGSCPAAIPEFSRLLDADRFEISLYVLDGAAEANGGESDAASVAILSLLRSGNRTRQYQALAPELAEQLPELQSAGLDIVIFTEELTASDGRLHLLASHRIAPLHVFAGATVSTGLLTADLVIASRREAATADVAAEFAERLALHQGCNLSFAEMPLAMATRSEARTNLGLPENAFVMMTAARSIEITPAHRQSWVELLRRIPNAYLAIQLLHVAAMPAGAIDSFAADWDSLLESAGVESNRVLVLGGTIDSLPDLQAVIVGADVFLDVGAFAEPDLLNVPLALQKPIVTTEGATFRSRRGAGLLRSLGLDALIAKDQAQLHQTIERLAMQPDEANAIAAKIHAMNERLPLCRDQLAVAESLGSLLEDAYDDLHANGSGEFRSGTPIKGWADESFSIEDALSRGNEALLIQDSAVALEAARDIFRVAPAHPGARAIMGRANIGLGQFATAVEYLLAAAQTTDDAATWFDLAVALYRNGQQQQAVQALETSLRLDATRADTWAMLVELANEIGAQDIAAEALAAFSQLAPADPRIAELTGRLRVA